MRIGKDGRFVRCINRLGLARMGIKERFSQTDRALEEVPTWPNVSHYTIAATVPPKKITSQIDKSLTTNEVLPAGYGGRSVVGSTHRPKILDMLDNQLKFYRCVVQE